MVASIFREQNLCFYTPVTIQIFAVNSEIEKASKFNTFFREFNKKFFIKTDFYL